MASLERHIGTRTGIGKWVVLAEVSNLPVRRLGHLIFWRTGNNGQKRSCYGKLFLHISSVQTCLNRAERDFGLETETETLQFGLKN